MNLANNNPKHVYIIGGGAAGIFSSVIIKSINPELIVTVLEKTESLLSKVRISGGGRCNVTHACFEPRSLANNYPRGTKELLGPFHRFQPKDMIEWLGARGVDLKTEEDGRMFPVTDSSSTIIQCLLKEAESLGVAIKKGASVVGLQKCGEGWNISLQNGTSILADILLVATGSAPSMLTLLEEIGHTIVPPVPSLFTFNTPTSPLLDLSGISLQEVEVSLLNLKYKGPLLLTHWGFSGPVILKLSAWAARILHGKKYITPFSINWVPPYTTEEVLKILIAQRTNQPNKPLIPLFEVPKNLWKRLLEIAQMGKIVVWQGTSNKNLETLAHLLTKQTFQMEGKTTFKQEFVTAGGVCLKEVDFKTMESKIAPNLFFAGEVLDIDGITGGFNFQNAWTTGWIAAQAIGFRDF